MCTSHRFIDFPPMYDPLDFPWVTISSDASVPENAVYFDGKLEGKKVYIGRVIDGISVLIGTAIPEKGICIYVDKNLSLKTSKDYRILIVDSGDPFTFEDIDLVTSDIFIAGATADLELLHVGRHIDSNGNTYYGWVKAMSKSVCIPRDSNQVVDKNFEVLIRKNPRKPFICPPCPV